MATSFTKWPPPDTFHFWVSVSVQGRRNCLLQFLWATKQLLPVNPGWDTGCLRQLPFYAARLPHVISLAPKLIINVWQLIPTAFCPTTQLPHSLLKMSDFRAHDPGAQTDFWFGGAVKPACFWEGIPGVSRSAFTGWEVDSQLGFLSTLSHRVMVITLCYVAFMKVLCRLHRGAFK